MTDDMYEVFADWAKRHGVEAAVSRFSQGMPGQVEEFERRWRADRARIVEGGPAVLAAGRNSWYSGPVQSDIFWPPLRRLFEREGWDAARIESVDSASNKVVAHTPAPSTPTFASRGLVVGYVQSGKTTNFTAVAAKLADEDYKFILVLSGIHNGLRRQTQERLEEQLYNLNREKWSFLTTPEQDFLPMGRLNPQNLFGPNSNVVALAVVKKNATVLRRLARWLDTPTGRQALGNVKVAIIDDEADQASVATASINPLILRLLSLMPRHSYIGYTATPFANVFIDPSTSADLYPRDFILNLPPPQGYFGPETVFGRDVVEGEDEDAAPDGHDMIRRIPDDEVSLLRPATRAAAAGFQPVITQDMRNAVLWFLLATAARRARRDERHSTMLVHTSIKTDVHESFKAPLNDLLRRLRSLLSDMDHSLLEELEGLWTRESERVPARDWGRRQNTFDEVLERLPEVLEACVVLLDNSRSDERLDYGGEDPVIAIVVGGNTLSRGLTLEGLVVSVFVRGASTYDTLLQMGRWFGYRTGYEDLPRIWTTEELELAFRHLAQVEVEMRRDIDRYQHQNLTPAEFAVRIRTHPSLQITAKMGSAVPAEISYSGARLQVRYYKRLDRDWLEGNMTAAHQLVTGAFQRGVHTVVASAGHHLIRGVPVAVIKNFLHAYQIHPKQADLNMNTLMSWIDRQIMADVPSLLSWNVVLIQGSSENAVDLGPLQIRPSIRARINIDPGSQPASARSASETADIKTLMSRRDIGFDLDIPDHELHSMTEAELSERRETHPDTCDRGLLVVYLIDAQSKPSRAPRATDNNPPARIAMDAVAPIIGIGMAFPGVRSRNRGVPTHMAVDLRDVEVDDASLYQDDPDESDQ